MQSDANDNSRLLGYPAPDYPQELSMGEIVIRDLDDRLVEDFRVKAEAANKSLEAYIRDLLEANRTFTPAERLAFVKANHSRFKAPLRSLTKDEIREGLI